MDREVYVGLLCKRLQWLLTACGVGQATIEKLSDDVLLESFDFYLNNETLHGRRIADKWHTLVHVCRRWRNVVFASLRRLDLRLLCRNDRPVRAMLDIWPALPINIRMESWGPGLDNLIAALEHPDRVRSISLIHVPDPHKNLLVAAMQVRFPELTELRFWNHVPVLFDWVDPPLVCTLHFRQHRP
jgi:hypothetical protein